MGGRWWLGVGGLWMVGGWEWPSYSFLRPAKLGLELSLAKIYMLMSHTDTQYRSEEIVPEGGCSFPEYS